MNANSNQEASTNNPESDQNVVNEVAAETHFHSAARRVSNFLKSPFARRSSIESADFAELALLDALTQAASDILAAIPAQRCIVFIYDKSASLLRPQVVVNCQDGGGEESTIDSDKLMTVDTAPVSFPPVMGMVSSCFLQKRCLKMQEPNPHRSFHREYDIPKDIEVDSILCAPVILYHRATAVIQLLNRLDTSTEQTPIETVERVPTPQEQKHGEIRLHRLKTVKAMIKTGFSIKDEQKLLLFTTHIAQAIENNMKKIETGRSEAKLREDKAKEAMELLDALNGNIVARIQDIEELMPTDEAKSSGRNIYMRRATITRLQSPSNLFTDMLTALVVITRLQAIFRGRRQRRHEKFAEELEKFRKQRERMRSLVVTQRVFRSDPNPKPKQQEPPAPPPSKPTTTSSSRPKNRFAAPTKTTQAPRKPPPNSPSPGSPKRSWQPKLPKAAAQIQRRISAKKIQKVYRKHRQRRQEESPANPSKERKITRETASAIKMQSFIRGNLVRKKLRRSKTGHQGPHIICLRVADSPATVESNQSSHEHPTPSQICIYAMPERSGKTRLMYRRKSIDTPAECQPRNQSHFAAVESRKLVAVQKQEEMLKPFPPARPRTDRPPIGVVWELPQQHFDPPGVEFVRHQSPRTTELRLPVLGPPKPAVGPRAPKHRSKLSAARSSLLCCLLPTQAKRSPPNFAPVVVQSLRKSKNQQRHHEMLTPS